MKLINVLRKIKKNFSNYSPSVEVLISRKNLIHNLNIYQKNFANLSFAPVLKSNAYGHGLIQIAQILDKEGAVFFVVDSLVEALALRSEGIKSKLLIIGYTSSENICGSHISDTAFTITSLDQLKAISRNLKKRKTFHLKLDTGMHRQGILLDEVAGVVKIIKTNKNILLEGVCSHLSDADGINDEFTNTQINRWNDVVKFFKENFETVRFFHLAATAGTNYSNKIYSNVGRLGLGLYGINPSPFVSLDLKPVLQMKAVVSSIKSLAVGEYVGYNNTYKTEKLTKVATVPVGYFEGVDRRLSNSGFFKVGEYNCPIVGRVSMNISSIDITAVCEVKLGDKVVIISDDCRDKNSIENIAKIANTIPYEILVHIPQHLRRIII